MTKEKKEVEFSEKENKIKKEKEELTEEQKKLLEEVLEIANRPRNMDEAII